ncbi:S8 family serine peptidase [Culturomica massiliensis]|uniref:S8 family serine peptidase n=1 Tax=Culturomica massiliensis TaxID=1841857 RepID=UPI000839141D|nr:S8 family serine peptidase [Culturomica massiliensis]
MNHKLFFLLLGLLFLGCQDDKLGNEDKSKEQPGWTRESRTNFLPGVIRIKLQSGSSEKVRLSSAAGTAQMGISEIDRIAAELGASQIKRVFPPAGKFEARQHAAGLDLWYDIRFNQDVPLTRAAAGLSSVAGIDIIEPVRRAVRTGGDRIVPADAAALAKPAATGTFNDPLLSKQWHYNNNGSIQYSVEGADINLQRAWDVTAGSREVIVAVVDGGIDINHEDLRDNVWRNEDEQEGLDDNDNNGYDGDVYGWNFVHDSPNIVAHAHGTHVAGTIAAVNNNGIGVCGVAGGSGNNDGVRVMSCQIFAPNAQDPNKDDGTQQIPSAIVYGANNGAVISQNSWSYTFDEGVTPTFPRATKEAIDYFITYAGIDETGIQTGPMKGGIVIFSAGNSNRDYLEYPAQYDKVLSVASMAPDFKKAYYSNYADWVDITAPGGSFRYGGKYNDNCAILSTLPDNNYGYMQGTSMACPHVSGVAALIVSEYGVGHPGFTPEDLRKRILNTARDIDAHNPEFAGKLGVGYIDAARAVQTDAGIAPEPVNDLQVVWKSNSAELAWSVTADQDNGTADHYDIYLSTQPFGNTDLSTLDVTGRVDVGNKAAGEGVAATLSNLTPKTVYYIAVVGVDMFGNRSSAAFESGETLSNQPPVVTRRNSGDILLKAYQTRKEYFDVTEPEGQGYTFTLNDMKGVSAALEGNAVVVTIKAPEVSAGEAYSGTAVLTVTDEAGAATVVGIPFAIEKNNAPVITQASWENMYFERNGEKQVIPLEDYFTDADGEALSYDITSSVTGLIRTDVENGQLTITSLKNGMATVTVTAGDYFGKTCSREFVVMSRDNRVPVDLYPNPVKDRMNIRMGKEVQGKIGVTLYNTGGTQVWESAETISPFGPAQVDLSRLPGGSYVVVVKYNGKEYKNNIVKL